MSKITRTFSDLDLTFTPHPTTKDLLVKYDDSAIKNAVKNLVLTRHYERPFHSEIGSNANAMLFELITPATAILLEQEITDVIRNFEPRVDVLQVKASLYADGNSINVYIVFQIKNTTIPITVQFALNRTR